MADWQNFYVITGSAAGALIGLQFVVLTLISSAQRRVSGQSASVYSSPTIVHFTTVLLLSACMVAPLHAAAASFYFYAVISGAGAAAVLYSARNALQMRTSGYKPEFEDWIFYALLPLASYALIAASAATRISGHLAAAGPYGIALATILLLVIGIHNAWDTVTYHVFQGNETKVQ